MKWTEVIEELRALAHRERRPFDPLWEPEARRLMSQAADLLESADEALEEGDLIFKRNHRVNK